MSAIKANKVEKALLKKGFVKGKGDHHFFEYYYNGKLQFYTKTSHNGQDVNDYLINCMKHQCKLNKKDFMDLINCPLTKKAYEKLLLDNGHIS